jgi:hypothetical protein
MAKLRRSRGVQAQLGQSGLGDGRTRRGRRRGAGAPCAAWGRRPRSHAARPLGAGARQHRRPQRAGLVAAGRGWDAGLGWRLPSGGWGAGRRGMALAAGGSRPHGWRPGGVGGREGKGT